MAGTIIQENGIVYSALHETLQDYKLGVNLNEINKWHGANKYEVLDHYIKNNEIYNMNHERKKKEIQQAFKNATIQAAKSAGAGNLPSGVKRLVDQMTNPQLSWRELLPQEIQSTFKSDYTMSTPSRKGRDEGYYLPGMDRENTIDIAMAIDTSGSMTDPMFHKLLCCTEPDYIMVLCELFYQAKE